MIEDNSFDKGMGFEVPPLPVAPQGLQFLVQEFKPSVRERILVCRLQAGFVGQDLLRFQELFEYAFQSWDEINPRALMRFHVRSEIQNTQVSNGLFHLLFKSALRIKGPVVGFRKCFNDVNLDLILYE